MKKIYSTPNTELLHLNIRPVMQSASLIVAPGRESATATLQDIGATDDALGKDDQGDINIWDAWDE